MPAVSPGSQDAAPFVDDKERARLAELYAQRVLDTPPEAVFDRITFFAAQLFGAPIALITLLDEHRQWFKSRYGTTLSETPRDHAFCDHAIRSDEVMVVEDAQNDLRFVANPLVTGGPNIRFYAGAPIRTRRGHRLGTVCVIDTKPRLKLEVDGTMALQSLAELASAELELRQALLLAKEQGALMERLSRAILAVEYAASLPALPQVAAQAASELLQLQPVRVTLDLRAFGGHLDAAIVPPAQAGALPLALDRLPIVSARGELGRIDSALQAMPGETAESQPDGQAARDALLQLARAVANRVEHLLLLQEASAANERLARSQRLEALGQLTGGVAHDFNNLLTVIMGNAEVLVERLPASSTERRLATMIGSAAQRGADLTQRLLAFARRQALLPATLDLNQLIAGLLPLLQRSLGEHIETALLRDEALWPTRADPAQLESALLNLALNARDAMPQGGRVTLQTANLTLDEAEAARVELAPGDHVVLTVADTGEGIAPEHVEHVFEPFFTTKATGRGTGLGLAMVYGFVKQSGGQVTLSSELGVGTRVRIVLPRWRGERTAPASARATDSLPMGTGQLVLLVEDEPLVREFASSQLQGLGYRVIEAADGPAAVAWLHQEPGIALLFTDMVMPGGMSGRDVADAARALRPGLPVLCTTGYTADEAVLHGGLAPGMLLLGKPYRRAELALKVHAALARPGA